MTFKKQIFIYFTFIFCLQSTLPATEWGEPVYMPSDTREWIVAYQNSSQPMPMMEYTLKNESINNWSELVTIQTTTSSLPSPKKYYEEFLKKMKYYVPAKYIKSRIIDEQKSSIIFEWSINDKSMAQHEWYKLIKDKKKSIIIRYTTKKMDQIENVRGVWERTLQKTVYNGEGVNLSESCVLGNKAKLDGTLFKDSRNTFQILQPLNWELMQFEESNEIIAHVFSESNKKGNLVVGILEDKVESLEEYISSDEKFMNTYKTKWIRTEWIEMPNGEQLRCELYGPIIHENGFAVNELYTILKSENKAHCIVASSKVNHFNEMLPILKAMIRSHQFVGE